MKNIIKKSIEILDDSRVRVNGEKADYDNLLSELDPIGEYETCDGYTLVLFPYGNGYIEYLLDSCYEHGESAIYTESTFEHIMDSYQIK
jgi:hypothetical protein